MSQFEVGIKPFFTVTHTDRYKDVEVIGRSCGLRRCIMSSPVSPHVITTVNTHNYVFASICDVISQQGAE